MKDLKTFIIEGNNIKILNILCDDFSNYLENENIDNNANPENIQENANIDTKNHIITWNGQKYFYFFNGETQDDRESFAEYDITDIVIDLREMAGMKNEYDDEFADLDEEASEYIDFMQDVEYGSQSTGNKTIDKAVVIASHIYSTIFEEEKCFTFVKLDDSYKEVIKYYNDNYSDRY